MILPLLLGAAAAAAGTGPEGLGRELAAEAARAGIVRVAVAEFTSEDAAGAEPAREAADGVLRGLLASGRVRASARDELPAVMAERRLAAAGAQTVPAPPRLAPADGVVLGRIRRTRDGWRADVRLVAVATGEIAASARTLVSPAVPDEDEEAERLPGIGALVDAAHALASTRDAGEIERLADSSSARPERRAAALLALAEAGGGDLVFADALRDREELVRFAGAAALGRTAAPWAEGPLRAMLRDDPSWRARFAAAQALSRYPSRVSSADLARTRAKDASWSVRWQAGQSLASLGEGAP